MDSLIYDVRAALRRLPKTPWFTLAVVATLAIAIGANTLIFSVVDGVLLRPLPFRDPSRLIAVVNPAGHKSYGVSVPDFLDWRRQVHRVDALATYGLGPATLTGRGTPERINAAVVTANWFSLLGVVPGSGRMFTPSDDHPEAAKVIVVSDAFWRSRFGASPTLVGETLTLDGQAFQVIGIAPPRFTYPSEPDIWLPDVLSPDDYAPDKRNLASRSRPRARSFTLSPIGSSSNIPRPRRTSTIRSSRSKRRSWATRAQRCSCCSAPSAVCC
jgi:hypothetical protein